MFDPKEDEKPIGKCKKCGIDLYFKKGEWKSPKCPNCGPITHKDINHYLYPQNTFE